jgi:hypothetical protein
MSRKTLRQALEQRAHMTQLPGLEIIRPAWLRKLRYHLDDGAAIESVLIRIYTFDPVCVDTARLSH